MLKVAEKDGLTTNYPRLTLTFLILKRTSGTYSLFHKHYDPRTAVKDAFVWRGTIERCRSTSIPPSLHADTEIFRAFELR